MVAEKGQMSKLVWWLVILIFFFVVLGIYFVLKGEEAGLLEKFFNLF